MGKYSERLLQISYLQEGEEVNIQLCCTASLIYTPPFNSSHMTQNFSMTVVLCTENGRLILEALAASEHTPYCAG